MASLVVNPSLATPAPPPPASDASKATNDLTSEDAFLKLLVAQIQHQDPLNPEDGVQFLSQLTGFSQLEQLIQINQELSSLTLQAAAPEDSTTKAAGS